MPRSRLFAAVIPPEPVLELIADLPRPQADGVRWTTRGQWHVTLRFYGTADEDDAVDAFCRLRMSPAAVRLGPAVRLLGDRVIHVPAAGLDDVAAAVAEATAGIGEADEGRPFRGHLTLGRIRRGRARPLVGHPIDAAFDATEVALLRSRTLPSGAEYSPVATVALDPGARS